MQCRARKVKQANVVKPTFTPLVQHERQGEVAMSIAADTRSAMLAQLAGRIDTLGREAAHLPLARLAHAIDDIRRDARAARIDAIAALATGLEREMALGEGGAATLLYLEAMQDALDADPLPPAAQTALLASVGLRLHG